MNNTNMIKSKKATIKDIQLEIRFSQSLLVVAIDVGKRNHCACFMSSGGKVFRKKYYFKNNREDFLRFMNQV